MYTKEQIKDLLVTNDKAVERAILRLYQYQTNTEQVDRETKDKNNVGFNGVDANLLSGFAEWLKSGKHLTIKQLPYARKKIIKYAGQLANIANSN